MKWIFACVAIALLVSDVELRRLSRRRRPNIEEGLDIFTRNGIICDPPNRSFRVQMGETEARTLGAEVPPYDLVDAPIITLDSDAEADEDCLFTVIIVAIYEKCLNQTSGENSEGESGNAEEEYGKYPYEVEEEESGGEESGEEESGEEESGEEESGEEGSGEEEPEEEEGPKYGYDIETLQVVGNMFYDTYSKELDFESGCVGSEYRPPTLIPGAGRKFIVIVVYKHNQEIAIEELIDVCSSRVTPCQFRDQLDLPNPYAASFVIIPDIADAEYY